MSHYYEIEGKKLPSVTQIIGDCTNNSAPLIQWGANQVVEYMRQNLCPDESCPYTSKEIFERLDKARFHFKDVSQTALDVGSEVHGMVEKYLSQHLDLGIIFDCAELVSEKSEQAVNAFNAFLDWEKEHNLKPIALEQTVYGNGWAGTLDFLGYFDDKLFVIDWKSSKAHYKEMDYQVAAYRSAIEENENDKVTGRELWADNYPIPIPDGCGVLRLDKETGLPEWHDSSKTYESDLAVFNAMVNLYMLRHPKIRKASQWKNF